MDSSKTCRSSSLVSEEDGDGTSPEEATVDVSRRREGIGMVMEPQARPEGMPGIPQIPSSDWVSDQKEKLASDEASVVQRERVPQDLTELQGV